MGGATAPNLNLEQPSLPGGLFLLIGPLIGQSAQTDSLRFFWRKGLELDSECLTLIEYG